MTGTAVEFYARIARAQIRVEAMKAANAERADRGLAPAYGEDAFLNIIDEEGIGHNATISAVNQIREEESYTGRCER